MQVLPHLANTEGADSIMSPLNCLSIVCTFVTKTVGHSQHPNLGNELLHPLFVDLRSFLAATLELAQSALKKGPLQVLEHRRMHA